MAAPPCGSAQAPYDAADTGYAAGRDVLGEQDDPADLSPFDVRKQRCGRLRRAPEGDDELLAGDRSSDRCIAAAVVVLVEETSPVLAVPEGACPDSRWLPAPSWPQPMAASATSIASPWQLARGAALRGCTQARRSRPPPRHTDWRWGRSATRTPP
ncbi:MAG: hypothetical protein QOJ63_1865 [Solirubrobacteraceae bacterium]|nr:hypothetical protein [Solirubrobacteraceae bacterium]